MAEILKEKGNENFKLKKYEEANRLYMDAIKLDPHNAVLYSNMSMTLIKLEQWQECIKVIDMGLLQSPDSKTKMKLLWRKGTAYSKINNFTQSRECYNDALKLDSKNQSLLKSIDELDAKESQFKRSHSTDEFETDKRVKVNERQVEPIPIFEVDELPSEFQQGPAPIKQSEPVKPSFKDLKRSPQSQSIQKITPKPSFSSPSPQSFPQTLTIHTLTPIINSPQTKESLAYIFSVPSSQYLKLFNKGNIDHMILNYVLDSIIYSLESSDTQETQQQAIDLLKAFPTVPRFSLVQLFVDKNKLQKLQALLGDAEIVEPWL